ncbi:hypothetical protein L3X38_018265 [Prunus dulcis]|uniref:Uncharacterized protein n=1 Tax=Prunus dulcis TaxID=3755 RepID=A0AAD4ZBG9_PRUDU|nr:hypothetical protein L3X38_018265 [Prunus dulcis]
MLMRGVKDVQNLRNSLRSHNKILQENHPELVERVATQPDPELADVRNMPLKPTNYGNDTAPQVTIYFHKLPEAGSPKRVGHRVTFTVDHAPIVNNVSKTSPKIKTSKAFVKVTKTELIKSPSKNSIRNARKRVARAFRKKTAQANSFELIETILVVAVKTPTSKTIKSTRRKVNGSITSLTTTTLIITQIMIGSIPITLTTTESVMVITTKEDKKVSPKTPKDQDSESHSKVAKESIRLPHSDHQ